MDIYIYIYCYLYLLCHFYLIVILETSFYSTLYLSFELNYADLGLVIQSRE